MCKICTHPQREAIDRCIMAGDSVRKIATMFNTSKDAIQRHKTVCMPNAGVVPPKTISVYERPKVDLNVVQTASTVLQRVSVLCETLEQQARECSDEKDRRNLNGTATALLKALELVGRITGEIGPSNLTQQLQINNNAPSLRNTPEWGIMIRVLDRHPEIRGELNAALKEAGL